jgi:16S rRNA (cytidine1402-2'-O)-methyltransferase
VATPIGNLRDVTLRALDVLTSVAAVAAEDTRVARQLLQRHAIHARVLSLHEHNEARASERVIDLLRQGRSVALVTDAGTPAISDPGALLVRRVRECGYRVVPVPGPNAAVAALSVAGLEDGRFLFVGFAPAQPAARRRLLEELRELPFSLVFYEAPHRVLEMVNDLAHSLGRERRIVIARELTKVFETVHECALGDAPDWLNADPNRLKGEFVLVVQGVAAQRDRYQEDAERVLKVLLSELPLKQAVKLAADITGAKRNALYERALVLRQESSACKTS